MQARFIYQLYGCVTETVAQVEEKLVVLFERFVRNESMENPIKRDKW